MSEQQQEEDLPVLRVVRGDATEEETAALLMVLSAASAASAASVGEGTATGGGRHSAWNDRAAALRAGLTPGPGAWRSSAWPR